MASNADSPIAEYVEASKYAALLPMLDAKFLVFLYVFTASATDFPDVMVFPVLHAASPRESFNASPALPSRPSPPVAYILAAVPKKNPTPSANLSVKKFIVNIPPGVPCLASSS